jgi:hypothetical protein
MTLWIVSMFSVPVFVSPSRERARTYADAFARARYAQFFTQGDHWLIYYDLRATAGSAAELSLVCVELEDAAFAEQKLGEVYQLK